MATNPKINHNTCHKSTNCKKNVSLIAPLLYATNANVRKPKIMMSNFNVLDKCKLKT